MLYDFVVFDFGLFCMLGIDLFGWICKCCDYMLVLVMIVCDMVVDCVSGLSVGVDDYFGKLFDLVELIVWCCVFVWCL